jgi:hypothetical protein
MLPGEEQNGYPGKQVLAERAEQEEKDKKNKALLRSQKEG